MGQPMPKWRRYAQRDVDQNMMRCVLDQDGRMVFVSPTLGWVIGQDARALTGKDYRAVFSIVSPVVQKLSDVTSGFFDVAVQREKRDPVVISARIDVVRAQDGGCYLVVWLDPDNKLRRNAGDFHQVAEDFASFIRHNQVKSEADPALDKPENENISTADSELRHFLNLSADLLGVYGRDMSFVRVNPAFNRITGYSDSELRKFPFIDLVHPEQKDHILNLMQKVIHAPEQDETRIDFECRMRCKNGTFRWIDWTQKATGKYIYIVGRDITDIKQHEDQLHRREEQLSEAQKIGRMGHWYLELGQNVMEWSDNIYNIFGVDRYSFVPSIDAMTAMMPKRELGRIYRAFERATVRKKDFTLEFTLRRPGPVTQVVATRYVRCEGRCKLNPHTGAVEAFFGILQDVTERTLYERDLQEAKEAAENAYASKTRFLANMSHELRTPLNAIIGFSEMMQRQLLGPVGNPRYLDYTNSIRQSGQHLLELINDILDMSKIEAGKYELYVEEMNIGKIIRLGIHMVEGRAEESQVRLIADDIPDDIQITADRRAIMQILLNLMSNAVKFTRAGGTVEIRCNRELGGVAISVSDTGIGIPKEKIGIITMPFEQVSSEFTRNHEGSGLGLAITKELIELHGGTLDINSEVGVGTVVTVYLPDKLPDARLARGGEI
jgi:two-component system cell cycle sensor histidine kinase PleC